MSLIYLKWRRLFVVSLATTLIILIHIHNARFMELVATSIDQYCFQQNFIKVTAASIASSVVFDLDLIEVTHPIIEI